MAEIAPALGTGQQVALIAELRWRQFRNSLRTKSARWDLVGLIFAGLMTGLFSVGIGVSLGAGAYAFMERGTYNLLGALFWAVFVVWQFVPVMMATSSANFDFRNLLRYPLRFSTFFALSLAYGLFDPAAVTAVFWLICIATGTVFARPDLLAPALLVFAVFAAMNLLLSRMVSTWLERILARRRTREAFWVLFFFCILFFQFSGMFAERWGRRIAPIVVNLAPLQRALPPGLAGKALAAAARGNTTRLAGSTALLAAYALAFSLLLSYRLRAQYRGEDLSETQAVLARGFGSNASSVASVPAPSLIASVLPGSVSVVFEKELRYIFRNSASLVMLAFPLVLIAGLSMSLNSPAHTHSRSQLAFPGAVAYMFLVLTPFTHNCLGYDGRGIQLLFVVPVRFRHVFIAKNLLLALVITVETLFVWLIISLLAGPPPPLVVAATFSALPFVLATHFLVGNWLSLKYPRRLEFGMHRRRASGVSLLLAFGLQFLLAGMAAVVVLLARLLGQMWLVPIIFLALSVGVLQVYVTTLDAFSRLALKQREVLIEQLAR